MAKEVLRLVVDVVGVGDIPKETSREAQRLAGSIIRLLQQAEQGSIDYEEEDDLEWTPDLEDEDGYVLDVSSAEEEMDSDEEEKVRFGDKFVSAATVQAAYEFYR